MLRGPLLRGWPAGVSFSTSARNCSYEDTISNLRIGKHTRVIFQGFTGKLISRPSLLVVINIGVRKTSTFTSITDSQPID